MYLSFIVDVLLTIPFILPFTKVASSWYITTCDKLSSFLVIFLYVEFNPTFIKKLDSIKKPTNNKIYIKYFFQFYLLQYFL